MTFIQADDLEIGICITAHSSKQPCGVCLDRDQIDVSVVSSGRCRPYDPESFGVPLRVIALSLPFVMVEKPNSPFGGLSVYPVDTRSVHLMRVSDSYAHAFFQANKSEADQG